MPDRNYISGRANMSYALFQRLTVVLRAVVGQTGNVDSIVWSSGWCELALTTEVVQRDQLTESQGVAALLVAVKRAHPAVSVTVDLGMGQTVDIAERGLDLFARADIEDFFAKRDRPLWAAGPDRRRGWPL